MKLINFILIFFPYFLFGQSLDNLEKNENLKKYHKILVTSFYNKNKKTGWSKKIILENGKIKSVENFNKSKLTLKTIFNYNNDELEYQIVTYEINKGITNDTTRYFYKYNEKGQLINKTFLIEEKFSYFNEQNLPELIENGNTKIDSLTGYKEELIYDEKGNIQQSKTYSKINEIDIIEINDYKYDSINNLTEIRRSEIPKQVYPIVIGGGRSHYEIENFRYVYNNDNLWIEKYWIVNNKEYLIEKRKFK